MTLETAIQRAHKGALFLDQHRPGWDGRVVKEHLDLASAHHCVLGQTHGLYGKALDMYGLSEENAVQLGFQSEAGEYGLLNRAWSIILEERALLAMKIDAGLASLFISKVPVDYTPA